MASVSFLAIIIAFVSFIFIIFSRSLKWNVNGIPWNWPILGMIPNLIYHKYRIHDRFVEILEEAGHTILLKGIWFTDMDILGTADPSNIHYIMTKSFENYSKGPDFKYIFDIFGDSLFTYESDLWKNERRIIHSLMHSQSFLELVAKTAMKKVEQGLVPVLDSVCENGSVIDLQDLFQRFSLDSTCLFFVGFDFNSLCIEFPEIPFSKAMDDVLDIIYLRHFIPKMLWEFQKKLHFGTAKRFEEAREIIDQTIAKFIALKRKKLERHREPETEKDWITCFISNKFDNLEINEKLLRDTTVSLMLAGLDTVSAALSWFFFSVANNPRVESKIREELEGVIIEPNEARKRRIFSIEEIKKLVYLHAALCESMRLYPPVPSEYNVPLQDDILPSGHHVNPKTKVLFSIYALGRMTSVWGEDCMEFKPERWISEKGTMKHVPSSKFMAFNSPTRTCLGKEVAFIQMKMVAAAIIHNYNIQQTQHNEVIPIASLILHMKYGFKVRVTNRWS